MKGLNIGTYIMSRNIMSVLIEPVKMLYIFGGYIHLSVATCYVSCDFMNDNENRRSGHCTFKPLIVILINVSFAFLTYRIIYDFNL